MHQQSWFAQEKKYTKIQKHPEGFATTKIQKHPAGFATTKKIENTDAPRRVCNYKKIKIATAKLQKHPAGFATADAHPEGFVLPKRLTCTAAPNGGSAEVL